MVLVEETDLRRFMHGCILIGGREGCIGMQCCQTLLITRHRRKAIEREGVDNKVPGSLQTLSSAESELKDLQKHCRELVVRSAESLDQAKTSPQLR